MARFVEVGTYFINLDTITYVSNVPQVANPGGNREIVVHFVSPDTSNSPGMIEGLRLGGDDAERLINAIDNYIVESNRT